MTYFFTCKQNEKVENGHFWAAQANQPSKGNFGQNEEKGIKLPLHATFGLKIAKEVDFYQK